MKYNRIAIIPFTCLEDMMWMERGLAPDLPFLYGTFRYRFDATIANYVNAFHRRLFDFSLRRKRRTAKFLRISMGQGNSTSSSSRLIVSGFETWSSEKRLPPKYNLVDLITFSVHIIRKTTNKGSMEILERLSATIDFVVLKMRLANQQDKK